MTRVAEADSDASKYMLPKDLGSGSYILNATNRLVSKTSENISGRTIYTYVFDITFAVDESYRSKISSDMNFDVKIASTSGVETENSFTLSISRQSFNNIDISNMKIESSVYEKVSSGDNENNSVYKTVHTTSISTSTLAPGSGSIMSININPTFAYYDYLEISYSGASVTNAVNFEFVERLNKKENNKFVRNDNANIEVIGSRLRYTPTAEEKSDGKIYLKTWINTTIDRDTTLKFTIKFFEANSETPLTYVNYYLNISYLSEPKITINDESIAYVARGTTADVKIVVKADQSIDDLVLEGATEIGRASCRERV